MPPALSEDSLLELSLWCATPRDVARLWEALCMWKRGVKADSPFWLRYLRCYFDLRSGCEGALDSALQRAGLRLDVAAHKPGLWLLQRLFVLRKCSRSGCLQRFRETENDSGACLHHSGKMRNGALTCCKSCSFRSPGCKVSFHDGSLYEQIFQPREKDQGTSCLPAITTSPPSAATPRSLPSVGSVSLPHLVPASPRAHTPTHV